MFGTDRPQGFLHDASQLPLKAWWPCLPSTYYVGCQDPSDLNLASLGVVPGIGTPTAKPSGGLGEVWGLYVVGPPSVRLPLGFLLAVHTTPTRKLHWKVQGDVGAQIFTYLAFRLLSDAVANWTGSMFRSSCSQSTIDAPFGSHGPFGPLWHWVLRLHHAPVKHQFLTERQCPASKPYPSPGAPRIHVILALGP